MNIKDFSIDIENIKKAGLAPGIYTVILGVTPFAGQMWLPLFVLMGTLAGASYMNIILNSGKNINLMNAGINAGILAGSSSIVYNLIQLFSNGLRYKTWTPSLGSFIITGATEAFIGFLAAFAWYVYKKEKTSI